MATAADTTTRSSREHGTYERSVAGTPQDGGVDLNSC
jgi:hypothetical protein